VLCRILGVPLSDDEQLIEWGDKMIGNTDPDLGGLHPASPESAEYRLYPFRSPFAMELYNYGHRIAAERRKEPRDDLVSKLVMWEDEEGHRLTEREFDTMFLLLVVAGNETTRQSIAHGMQALMDNAEAMTRLRDDPSLMGTATEEIMRYASPVLHFRRTATTEAELHGVRIREGDKVVVWLVSANFDEQQFPSPLDFDVARKPNNHVTFGRGGPHFCLGAHLAKLETRIMFEELLPRVSSIEPAGPARRMHSNFTNAYKSMPVRVTPA
jgi:cytochrome P450